MTLKIFVPLDTVTSALDGELVNDAIEKEAEERKLSIEIVRNGSRGLFWLEPLIEIETSLGRIGYGPVTPGDVKDLFDAWIADPNKHSLCLGRVDDFEFLKKQSRKVFSRVGIINPLSLAEYREQGGLVALSRVLDSLAEDLLSEIETSKLRGRGGAAFPSSIKWRTVQRSVSDVKYVICNADEGDSGNYADRLLMEADPFAIIEGMIIAGVAVGASKGFIYIRSEYPFAINVIRKAVAILYDENIIGANILGTWHHFDIEVRVGAGSYVCGEETALIESIEGKRGVVRAKPPVPAINGLFGRPTLVHNVLTLATIPLIFSFGGEQHASYGVANSRGTMPYQLSGNIRYAGLIEAPYGITLGTLLYEYGGGSLTGRPIKAVQIGGPLGSYLPEQYFDISLDYESLIEIGGTLGHGGIVVFDDTVNMADQARYAMKFCAVESCGKCTPCRIGSIRGVELIDEIIKERDVKKNIHVLKDLCETMKYGSLCAMGSMTPLPVLSALKHFESDFRCEGRFL